MRNETSEEELGACEEGSWTTIRPTEGRKRILLIVFWTPTPFENNDQLDEEDKDKLSTNNIIIFSVISNYNKHSSDK